MDLQFSVTYSIGSSSFATGVEFSVSDLDSAFEKHVGLIEAIVATHNNSTKFVKATYGKIAYNDVRITCLGRLN
jgi:hypothetical protein